MTATTLNIHIELNATVLHADAAGAVDNAPASGVSVTMPWGPQNLYRDCLAQPDPPTPTNLTNALGMVDDYLADLDRAWPLGVGRIEVTGSPSLSVARLEAGVSDPAMPYPASRADLEEVFRLVSRERQGQRAENPGVASDETTEIVATLCIILAAARRYRVTTVNLDGPTKPAEIAAAVI